MSIFFLMFYPNFFRNPQIFLLKIFFRNSADIFRNLHQYYHTSILILDLLSISDIQFKHFPLIYYIFSYWVHPVSMVIYLQNTREINSLSPSGNLKLFHHFLASYIYIQYIQEESKGEI